MDFSDEKKFCLKKGCQSTVDKKKKIHKPWPWNYKLPFVFQTPGWWQILRQLVHLILFAPTFQLRCWTAAVAAGSQFISETAGTSDWQDTRMWIRLDVQHSFFVVDLSVRWLWCVGSELVVQLSDRHNVHKPVAEHVTMRRSQRQINKRIRHWRVLSLQRQATKAKDETAGVSPSDHRNWTSRTLIITFHLILGAAWDYQQKESVFYPHSFLPYYQWLPHFNKQHQQQCCANRLHWNSDITNKPSGGDGTKTLR